MSNNRSNRVIYAAIATNIAIMIVKFIVAAFTHSSAMLAEGIHSLIDSGDGFLLLIGVIASAKPADDDHPFGYGKELYFWTLIVAIMIFAVGGGMSILEGINHLRLPHPVTEQKWAYIVLALSFLFEGISFIISLKELMASKLYQRTHSVWRTVRSSKDPAVFTVVFEDAAALLGLTIAFVGIYLGSRWQLPWLDGAASIIIGLLLAAVAMLLARESRELLVGESASSVVVASIKAIADNNPQLPRYIKY